MSTEFLQWHPAFYAVAQIELLEERDKLGCYTQGKPGCSRGGEGNV